jgi:hypothetical protein
MVYEIIGCQSFVSYFFQRQVLLFWKSPILSDFLKKPRLCLQACIVSLSQNFGIRKIGNFGRQKANNL